MVRITILAYDGQAVEVEINANAGSMTVVTNVQFETDRLILHDLHVDGPGANAFGGAGLRRIVQKVMEDHDLAVLEVHGFRRTTGANPGRRPQPLVFRRR